MSRYFIAATDYGAGNNDTYPRWRVYAWNVRREPWGHIGNHPVSGYFWTHEEAYQETQRLEKRDSDDSNTRALILTVILGAIVLLSLVTAIVVR